MALPAPSLNPWNPLVAGIGFVGAPIATSITRICQCAALLYYLRCSLPQHSQTWPTFSVASLKALSRENCFQFLSFALPGCSMIALEAWAFEVTFFMVAFLGAIELDAHTWVPLICITPAPNK